MRKLLASPGVLRRCILLVTWLVLIFGLAPGAEAAFEDSPDTLDVDEMLVGPNIPALHLPILIFASTHVSRLPVPASPSDEIVHPPIS
jgi:NhaP-type Na+/H+ or K+/H+ antiporter